jgi:hypothetical protein
MSNIKIFRANRGEGKTKWLVEQAQREYDAGKLCVFLGKHESFANIWASIRHEACPIEFRDHLYGVPFGEDLCVFVDEFFKNDCLRDIVAAMSARHATWYITMDKAHFVS